MLMENIFAERVNKVPPYIFVQISRKIAAKKAQGINVISFGIGDPDLPTPPNIINGLISASKTPSNHRYPESEGIPSFRKEVSIWYKTRFGIELNPENEIISLIGAKEGIGHAAFCFINPGDIALVPDPGYPVYSIGTLFAGGQSYIMPLTKTNGWLPDIDAIPANIANKSKVIWLNYPNNPTGAIATLDYYKHVVKFAEKYNIAVLHDACYTEITYDGYKPQSFLETPGAMDIGAEFHSLSKTFNMTGWRLGMAAGNKDIIDKLLIVKSNLDSGVPAAIQEMGVKALQEPPHLIHERNEIYKTRRDSVINILRDLGLTVDTPKASLYIWARVPVGFTSESFSETVLEQCDVFLSPGTGYGENGAGYVRLSLTLPDKDIKTALERMSKLNI